MKPLGKFLTPDLKSTSRNWPGNMYLKSILAYVDFLYFYPNYSKCRIIKYSITSKRSHLGNFWRQIWNLRHGIDQETCVWRSDSDIRKPVTCRLLGLLEAYYSLYIQYKKTIENGFLALAPPNEGWLRWNWYHSIENLILHRSSAKFFELSKYESSYSTIT